MKGFLSGLLARLVASTLVACYCGIAVGQEARPAAELFARPAEIQRVVLSPSGERLAMLVNAPGGTNRLVVLDLPAKGSPRLVAGYNNAQITRVAWVNDIRLVYEAFDLSEGIVVRENRAGTFAVNHDGANSKQLIAWRRGNDSTGTLIASRVLTYTWRWVGQMNGGDEIWVSEAQHDSRGEWTGSTFARLNTLDGTMRRQPAGLPTPISTWLTGHDEEVRVVQTAGDGRAKLYWRPGDGKDWVLLQDEDYVRGSPYAPRFLEADGRLIVSSRIGQDTIALHAYDTMKRQLESDPVVAVKGFDLRDGTLEIDYQTHKVVGLHFLADRPQSYWFNDKLRGIQQSLDAALPPGRFNRISCGRCESSRFLVVHSTSDRQPGEFYLYDREARTLQQIGSARPWLNEASQAERTFHRMTARDGLEMPVYVTHPAGSKRTDRLPAVVLVHGGPWARGASLEWDQDAQFLASRGYRVIEPEFRGSTGYGTALFQAGIKQWGRAMQDDLVDAVQWAAKQGLVDEKRVCIMGSSYGGYAALMGAVRDSGSYRCAISFAGVTDIELRYTAWGNDLSDESRRYVLPYMIGSPDTDAEWLRAVSPLLRAGEIKIPVLLAHGSQDDRVPQEHATRFAAAARKAGIDLTFKLYENAGHGWARAVDQADFYTRVEAFLSKHLPRGDLRP